MSLRLNRAAYEQLVAEDIAWLEQQPRTLERDHIIDIVSQSTERYYKRRVKETWNPDLTTAPRDQPLKLKLPPYVISRYPPYAVSGVAPIAWAPYEGETAATPQEPEPLEGLESAPAKRTDG